jgi:hypothetical protein
LKCAAKTGKIEWALWVVKEIGVYFEFCAAFENSANLYLIMELINGGELTSLIYDEDSPIIMEEGGMQAPLALQ